VFAAFACRRSHVRALHVALAACINSRSRNKAGGFLPVSAVGDKQADLAADRRSGLATTRVSAWSSQDFKKAFGAQAAEAALTNLQNADVDRSQGDPFPSALKTDPRRLS